MLKKNRKSIFSGGLTGSGSCRKSPRTDSGGDFRPQFRALWLKKQIIKRSASVARHHSIIVCWNKSGNYFFLWVNGLWKLPKVPSDRFWRWFPTPVSNPINFPIIISNLWRCWQELILSYPRKTETEKNNFCRVNGPPKLLKTAWIDTLNGLTNWR